MINDLPEVIGNLLRQETTFYKCEDYLSPEFQRERQDELLKRDQGNFLISDRPDSCDWATSSSTSSGDVSESWREKICEWSYQVIDHFDFEREVVAISLNYLDRFLATRPVNKKLFQLAAMTTLYLAIKLYDPNTLKISSLIDLSRGYFMVEHIVAMEETILGALNWHIHPPTPLTFIRHILELLPADCCTPSVRHDILELARFLVELCVCDYYFVNRKPSSVALAALLNALESVGGLQLPYIFRKQFLDIISNVLQLDCKSEEVEHCRARLRDMYFQGGYSHQAVTVESPTYDRSSPQCVSELPCNNNATSYHEMQSEINNCDSEIPRKPNKTARRC